MSGVVGVVGREVASGDAFTGACSSETVTGSCTGGGAASVGPMAVGGVQARGSGDRGCVEGRGRRGTSKGHCHGVGSQIFNSKSFPRTRGRQLPNSESDPPLHCNARVTLGDAHPVHGDESLDRSHY